MSSTRSYRFPSESLYATGVEHTVTELPLTIDIQHDTRLSSASVGALFGLMLHWRSRASALPASGVGTMWRRSLPANFGRLGPWFKDEYYKTGMPFLVHHVMMPESYRARYYFETCLDFNHNPSNGRLRNSDNESVHILLFENVWRTFVRLGRTMIKWGYSVPTYANRIAMCLENDLQGNGDQTPNNPTPVFDYHNQNGTTWKLWGYPNKNYNTAERVLIGTFSTANCTRSRGTYKWTALSWPSGQFFTHYLWQPSTYAGPSTWRSCPPILGM